MIALIFATIGLGLVGWLAGRARAVFLVGGAGVRRGVIPVEYGWYVAIATLAPALLFLLLWSAIGGSISTVAGAVALLLAIGGGGIALARLRPGFATRAQLERIVVAALL
ncbi:MAG: hypothetical protein EOP68_18560, partial [Sphingomonas sp.]